MCEKVSQRSRRDYERTMLLVTDMITKKGDRLGDRKVKAITPVSADKITSGSLLVHAGSDHARAKRLSGCVHAHGVSCTASIQTSSTTTSRTHGAV